MTTATKRTVPASAGQLAFGAAELEAIREQNGVRTAPIKLQASSGQAFNHPYWGRLVFDFSGARWTNEKLTLDWCHRGDEVIGYADDIQAGQSLTVAGELVSTEPQDRAHKVMAQGRAGIPFEASLRFDLWNNFRVEEYQAGMSAVVNGQQFEGPITVIRECLIRSVAVCPSGADPYTSAEFAAGDAGGEIDVHVFSPEAKKSQAGKPDVQTEGDMSEKPQAGTVPADENQAAAGQAGKPDVLADQAGKPDVPDPRAEFAAKLKDYTERFGAEDGAQWAAEDKPLLDCYAARLQAVEESHAATVAKLQSDLDAQTGAVTELQERLDSLALGEQQPLSSTPGEQSPAQAKMSQYEGRLPNGLAMFAASAELPTKKQAA